MKRLVSCMLTLVFVLTTWGVNPVDGATTETLTIDCDNVIREVTQCASGSLYGVTETVPADINNLVRPLNPYVFTSPARAGSGYQQPMGAAIDVAGRLQNTSGEVMIRLADLCPNWPYSFPGMSSWLAQVSAVIDDKLASGYDNYYGYEIWNEPVYTWNNNNGSFYNLWSQTYALIRQKDPSAKIIGPSEGFYDHNRMYDFLNYCKQNNCLPDIVCWHELSSNGQGSYIGDLANTLKDYRNLEASLGISQRPISINEYCDINHSKEGCPGSMARYIAKFERYKVDSACISWWWTAHPGRLGSLLATDSRKGAGWWFYKWYGDMSGNMVQVTPRDENSGAVDGFASVDYSKQEVTCLFGGDNGGNIVATFRDLPSFIGNSATVRVERIGWSSKDTVASDPMTSEAAIYQVNNRSITVSLSGCDNTTGYRILVMPGVSSSQTRYEAENAMITEANIFNSSNASNGAYVGQIDFSNTTMPRYSYVDFLVNVPTTRTYSMAIRYANGSGAVSTHGLAYNGGGWQTVTYPETSGWAQFNTVYVDVQLTAGLNVIRLAKGSPYFAGANYYAELDYIQLN